jgi:hypothetical protein
VRADDFFRCNGLLLPYPPVIEVVSVVYLDEAEDEQTVNAADYSLAGQRLYAKSSFTYPMIGPDYEGVRNPISRRL